MHLYLAGPFRPIDQNGVQSSTGQNVERAVEIAAEAFDAGHTPVTPHLLTHQPAKRTDAEMQDHEFWLPKTQEYLRRCDAILLMPFWEHSTGSQQEKAYAEEVGMPVYEYDDGIPPLHPTEKASPAQCTAFIEQVMKMYRTHLSKNADYSPANIMGTGELGVTVRLWDKMSRLMQLVGFDLEIPDPASFDEPSDPNHESIEDTLLDLSTYGIIGKLVREDKWAK